MTSACPLNSDSDTRHALKTIPGGRFRMGSEDHYPEEAPSRWVEVAAFQIARSCVTNAAFAEFVRDTGYVTTCEREPVHMQNPDMPASFFQPGSLVFQQPSGPVPLSDPRRWWSFIARASWRQPEGPYSSLEGREGHPVVHVSFHDAMAYAEWAGLTLPSEAQWEYTAHLQAEKSAVRQQDLNIWHGSFPHHNLHRNTAPYTVDASPKSSAGNGPFHMLGNVWEWTADRYSHPSGNSDGCCGTDNSATSAGRRVLKGGSFLCADNYCRRYRRQARMGYGETETASHIGFRCAAVQ